jgi:hypothetical protein
MADAVLRLTDVIVPEVFADYITEESITKTSFFRSGILRPSEEINQKIAGGGTTFNMPFWQRLSGDAQAVQSNTSIDVKKTTTSKMVARRLMFAKGWSAEELASALAGEDAMGAITEMVDQYWEEQLQGFLLSTIKGVIDDNEDNDSGDLVNKVFAESGDGLTAPAASNKISSDNVIDTYSLLGDASSKFTAIAMHSTPYYELAKLNLITFEPTNTQDIGWGTYLGMTVLVNDQMTSETVDSFTVYWTVLFQPGAFGWGESANGITPVETNRNSAKSEDQLFTRRQFAMHPHGFKWVETSVADDMPTKAELEQGGNWDRVMEKKNCGFVVLKSN